MMGFVSLLGKSLCLVGNAGVRSNTFLLVYTLYSLSSCHSITTTSDGAMQPVSSPSVGSASGAPTATTAQGLVARYLQAQPQAELYQLDAMRVVEADMHWQVLVRTTHRLGRTHAERCRFRGKQSNGQYYAS